MASVEGMTYWDIVDNKGSSSDDVFAELRSAVDELCGAVCQQQDYRQKCEKVQEIVNRIRKWTTPTPAGWKAPIWVMIDFVLGVKTINRL